MRRYDKSGDQFYDTISALHKSVRGSDPDASLYWFARMIDGGADARYIARRMVRMASEDIGLADPRALRLTLDAAETYERLGSPEGELALAEARGLSRDGAEVERGLQGLESRARLRRQRRHAAGADAHPQCADQADEAARPRRRLPLRARRGRRASPRAKPTCPKASSTCASTSRRRAGSRSKIGERLAQLRAKNRAKPDARRLTLAPSLRPAQGCMNALSNGSRGDAASRQAHAASAYSRRHGYRRTTRRHRR